MGTVLKGVDYSFPGAPAAIKAAGYDFATVESSIGMHDNTSGAASLAALKKAGLLASLFHYAIFTNDPAAEADALVARVKRFEAAAGSPCDYAISIDIEQPKHFPDDLSLPLPPEQIIAWLDVFIPRVRSGLGYFPLAYIYQSYLKMLDVPALASSALKDCPLWLADYDFGENPTVPGVARIFDPKNPLFVRNNPWTVASAKMYQTRGNATVPGVPHIVDTDVFFGTLDDLKATRGGGLASVLPAPVAAAVDAVTPAPPPNNLPASVSTPVQNVVSGRAGIVTAIALAVGGALVWLLQHFRR